MKPEETIRKNIRKWRIVVAIAIGSLMFVAEVSCGHYADSVTYRHLRPVYYHWDMLAADKVLDIPVMEDEKVRITVAGYDNDNPSYFVQVFLKEKGCNGAFVVDGQNGADGWIVDLTPGWALADSADYKIIDDVYIKEDSSRLFMKRFIPGTKAKIYFISSGIERRKSLSQTKEYIIKRMCMIRAVPRMATDTIRYVKDMPLASQDTIASL